MKRNRGSSRQKSAAVWLLLLLSLITLLSAPLSAFAEATVSTRWGDASDEIDKYLDAAFEHYLDGDASAAYNAVNDAYFRVYEVTGFERQTMSYISGPRKNAVELQYSTCKGAVKKSNEDDAIKTEVRTELNKLKAMIREDGNKLAIKDGEPITETKYYLRGELVPQDPYAELAGDPKAVRNLRNAGLVTVDGDMFLHLTPDGHQIAKQVHERHCFLTERLISIGVNPRTAEQEACEIEDVLSQDTFECLRTVMEKKHRENHA